MSSSISRAIGSFISGPASSSITSSSASSSDSACSSSSSSPVFFLPMMNEIYWVKMGDTCEDLDAVLVVSWVSIENVTTVLAVIFKKPLLKSFPKEFIR